MRCNGDDNGNGNDKGNLQAVKQARRREMFILDVALANEDGCLIYSMRLIGVRFMGDQVVIERVYMRFDFSVRIL